MVVNHMRETLLMISVTLGLSLVSRDLRADDRAASQATMSFTDVTQRRWNDIHEEGALRGIDDFDGGSHRACFADLDNDGHDDLYNGATRHLPHVRFRDGTQVVRGNVAAGQTILIDGREQVSRHATSAPCLRPNTAQ